MIKEITGDETVRFFVSPYVRTRETFAGIATSFGGIENIEWEEHPALREHEKGQLNTANATTPFQELRAQELAYSKFFFRWPGGESLFD